MVHVDRQDCWRHHRLAGRGLQSERPVTEHPGPVTPED